MNRGFLTAGALALAVGLARPAGAAEPEWTTDLAAALARAAKEQKNVVVHVHTDKSADSVDFQKNELNDAKVKDVLAARICVRVDPGKDWKSSVRYGIKSAPAILVFSPRGIQVINAPGRPPSAADLATTIEGADADAKKWDGVLAEREKEIAADPANLEARRKLATMLAGHKNFLEAVEAFRSMATCDKIDAKERLKARFESIRLCTQLRLFDEVVKDADEVVKGFPESKFEVALALFTKAGAQADDKKYVECKATIEDALKRLGDSPTDKEKKVKDRLDALMKKVDEALAAEKAGGDKKPEEKKPDGEKKPEEKKPEEKKPEEKKPEEKKPEEPKKD